MNGSAASRGNQSKTRYGGAYQAPPFFMSRFFKIYDVGYLITISLILFISIFFLYPVIKVFAYPSWAQYVNAITRPLAVRALKNSLFITLLSTISSVFVGFLFAYAMNYTNIPGKSFFHIISILPLLSPPFVVALAWILLFGPRGLITYNLLHVRWNIFGWKGLWLVQTIAFFPYAYLVIDNVLSSIDPSLEYAAINLGGTGKRTFLTVTVPLALPGIVNAALLNAIYILADFGNPIVIAGDWPVLPTTIYGLISGHYDVFSAAALSIVLLFPSIAIYIFSQLALGSKSYVTITGKGSALPRKSASHTMHFVLFVFCSFITLIIIAVYGILLVGAFTETWGIKWTLTLRHWSALTGTALQSLVNSLVCAIIAGLAAAFIGLMGAQFIHKRAKRIMRLWDFTFVLPAAIPGIFLGIGYLLAFNAPPIMLTGTLLILILALLVWNIPIAYQTCVAAIKQIGDEIPSAAITLGASPVRAFLSTVAPLLRGPFAYSFVMGFLRAVTNLSIVIFLIGPGRNVATVHIMNLIQYAEIPRATVLTVALFGIAIIVAILAQALLGIPLFGRGRRKESV
jgi:iron(III) transport system permease protein